MKNIFGILIISLIMFSCRTGTQIYIVRHAEKEANSQDPDLTAEGKQRAQDLASYLRKKKIKVIYSTETKRTKQTATPLSEINHIAIQPYKNDTLQKFLYHILERGNNTLIVGHSNTTITMLNELSLNHTIKEIPDDDYDNLFVVTLESRSGLSGFRLKLKETTYGKKSPTAKK